MTADKKKTILAVDDDPAFLRLVENNLKAAGYEVITASDGDEAFKMASSRKPDLVVLDLLLPKVDGWRVCQKLKMDPLCKHIPVILLSGLIEKEYPKQEMEAADAFLGKPVEFENLLATIKRLFAES